MVYSRSALAGATPAQVAVATMPPPAAALGRDPLAGAVDEDLPHRAGGRREEVRPPKAADPVVINEPHVRLVYQRRLLQGMVPPLADELAPKKIRVNQLVPGRIATERVAQLDLAAGKRALGVKRDLRLE